MGSRSDDHAWNAFRYVAGELTDVERAAFEAQLLSDPELASAVAEAVELTELIRAAGPMTIPLRRRHAIGSMPLWAAAAVVVMAGGVWWIATPPAGVADPKTAPVSNVAPSVAADRSSERDKALALLWTELRDDFQESPLEEPAWLGDEATWFAASPPAVDVGEVEPPAWLLLAAAAHDEAVTLPAPSSSEIR